jgi:zinc transporter ZupT
VIAFAVETTTLIGAIVSMIFIRDISLLAFGVILAHIGGGFVYLTAQAMLGEMIKHERKSILVYAVLGFVVVLVASLAISMLGA